MIRLKKLGLLLPVYLVITFACSPKEKAKLHFDEATLSFIAKKGDKVTKQFTFTNQGEEDLQIISVDADCGCTVAKFSEEKIAAGESGVIELIYDSKDDSGLVQRNVLVEANTEPALTPLSIKGTVL